METLTYWFMVAAVFSLAGAALWVVTRARWAAALVFVWMGIGGLLLGARWLLGLSI